MAAFTVGLYLVNSKLAKIEQERHIEEIQKNSIEKNLVLTSYEITELYHSYMEEYHHCMFNYKFNIKNISANYFYNANSSTKCN